jgi:diadenylate cyclase
MREFFQSIQNYLLSIQNIELRWQDFFEIIVLAFIIYRIIYVLKGTLAVHVLSGILILVGVSIFAERCDLRTIKWLLQGFWSIWFLVIIIILQPELRRMLAFAGKYGIFRKIKLLEVETITAIIQAITLLSESRIGALIVIERETGLRTYQEMGVRIDASVTSDLLLNIFNPNTHLHDGAVIINNGRLASACSFLPLSKSPKIEPSMGSRHRAAIGLTEETDAISIIVSEETGHISIAFEGELKRNLLPVEVENFLSNILLKTKSKDSNPIIQESKIEHSEKA